MSVAYAENTITIEWPQGALAPIAETPEAFAKEMRVAAALFWYAQGRISAGQAGEYAGLSEFGLIAAWAAAKFPAFPLETEESMAQVKGGLGSRDASKSSAGNGPGEMGNGPTGSRSDTQFVPEVAEAHYQALGRWKGDLAAPAVQKAAREFWQSAGETGARWLARRLRWEYQVDTLHAAAARLADLAGAAIAPMLAELGGHPATDQAWALLQALGRIGESSSAPTLEATSVELILAQFLQHRDPDVRENAALALRLLPPDRAAYWLRRRRLEEKDPYVTRTIEEELTQLQAAGG